MFLRSRQSGELRTSDEQRTTEDHRGPQRTTEDHRLISGSGVDLNHWNLELKESIF